MPFRLVPDAPASEIWSYGADGLPPVLRTRRGAPFTAVLDNRLPELSSIHWHGIRLPNAMDGVPYVTQPPVLPGERFAYRFTPPDAGTFFFHPHCDTVQQLGRGLVGVLLVEDPDDPPFDAELVLAYKDWIRRPDGTLGPFLTTRGAANQGTFGNLATVGFRPPATHELPAGADVRLRCLNLDSTRMLDLLVDGAEAFLIATDGNPLPPTPLGRWRLGPAMRADIALRLPDQPGVEVRVLNGFAAKPVTLMTLRTRGPALRRPPFRPPMLAGPHLPPPDLDAATPRLLSLGTAAAARSQPPPADLALPNGQVLRYADALCLSPTTLWAIDRQPWPEAGHAALPEPLFTAARGETVVLDLQNISKVPHPIHLHGHTFRVLPDPASGLPEHWADTTLVAPGERRRIAFVADNPGDWMLHCHVIEHQETGMMALFRVA